MVNCRRKLNCILSCRSIKKYVDFPRKIISLCCCFLRTYAHSCHNTRHRPFSVMLHYSHANVTCCYIISFLSHICYGHSNISCYKACVVTFFFLVSVVKQHSRNVTCRCLEFDEDEEVISNQRFYQKTNVSKSLSVTRVW